MKRLRDRVPACVLCLVVAVLGLGSATPPAGPKIHVILIESMKFKPDVITVRLGEAVEFRNVDLVPHTVTERSTRSFDSGMINAKATWTFLADEEGTYRYRCIYHPDMMGTIVVAPTPKTTARRQPTRVELCGAP